MNVLTYGLLVTSEHCFYLQQYHCMWWNDYNCCSLEVYFTEFTTYSLKKCKIWGSYNSVDDDSYLLGYAAVLIGKFTSYWHFREACCFHDSEDGSSRLLQEISTCLPVDRCHIQKPRIFKYVKWLHMTKHWDKSVLEFTFLMSLLYCFLSLWFICLSVNEKFAVILR
jgi:hypothetical protein